MKPTTDSQVKQLRTHLQSGKSIAPLQALNTYGIYRLSARIHEIRNDAKKPLNVKTEMMFVGPVKYAKYFL
jgi:hypothetical protein